MWQQWLTGLLGLWLVLLAFLGFSGDSLTWSLMITGFLVTALGFWGLETSGHTADSGRGSYSDSVFQ
ncbi:MAG: hypothetical protein V4681_03440 [Patescibacteria group bacterium]